MNLFLTSVLFVCFCSIGVCVYVCAHVHVHTRLLGIEARALHMHTDVSSCENPNQHKQER